MNGRFRSSLEKFELLSGLLNTALETSTVRVAPTMSLVMLPLSCCTSRVTEVTGAPEVAVTRPSASIPSLASINSTLVASREPSVWVRASTSTSMPVFRSANWEMPSSNLVFASTVKAWAELPDSGVRSKDAAIVPLAGVTALMVPAMSSISPCSSSSSCSPETTCTETVITGLIPVTLPAESNVRD